MRKGLLAFKVGNAKNLIAGFEAFLRANVIFQRFVEGQNHFLPFLLNFYLEVLHGLEPINRHFRHIRSRSSKSELIIPAHHGVLSGTLAEAYRFLSALRVRFCQAKRGPSCRSDREKKSDSELELPARMSFHLCILAMGFERHNRSIEIKVATTRATPVRRPRGARSCCGGRKPSRCPNLRCRRADPQVRSQFLGWSPMRLS
jgi:hypothetical protein